MRAPLLLVAVLTGSVALAACGSDTEVTAGRGGATGLEGVQWNLNPASTLGVPLGDSSVTALLDGGQISGFGGCNQYMSTYTLKGDKLTIASPVASTQMACEAPVVAVEQAYLTRLAATATYKVDGGTLTLSDASGAPSLVYDEATADALNGSWTATSLRTATAVTSVLPGVDLTMVVDGETVSGSGGCNNYNGSIKIDGMSVTIGLLAKTARACEQAIMDQETAFLKDLQDATSYKVTGDRLDLLMADGTIAATFTKG